MSRVAIKDVFISSNQLNTGDSFAFSANVYVVDWLMIKNDFSNWQDVKNLTNWASLYNYDGSKNRLLSGDYMAVKQVRVKLNGAYHILTLNSTTGNYDGTVAAPNVTSYNVNSGHYYPLEVEATSMSGLVTTKNDQDSLLGNKLRLRVLEKVKPVVTIISPTTGAYISNNTPNIEFTLVDESNGSGINIATLKLQIDSQPEIGNTAAGMSITPIPNGYKVVYKPQQALSDGQHTINVKVSDNDGNQADQKQVTVNIDTVPPELIVTNPATNGLYVSDARYNVTGTTSDSGSVTVEIFINGTSVGNATIGGNSFAKEVMLRSGQNTIKVVARDLAGQTTEITRSITLDTEVPTITNIILNPNPVDAGQSLLISVSAS